MVLHLSNWLMISSKNKIKFEEWLFRFLFASCRNEKRKFQIHKQAPSNHYAQLETNFTHTSLTRVLSFVVSRISTRATHDWSTELPWKLVERTVITRTRDGVALRFESHGRLALFRWYAIARREFRASDPRYTSLITMNQTPTKLWTR